MGWVRRLREMRILARLFILYPERYIDERNLTTITTFENISFTVCYDKNSKNVESVQ